MALGLERCIRLVNCAEYLEVGVLKGPQLRRSVSCRCLEWTEPIRAGHSFHHLIGEA